MSRTPEERVEMAHEQLRIIKSELNNLPDCEEVREVRNELQEALGSTNPGTVSHHSSLGMFLSTEVDDKFGTSLSDDFATAMNLTSTGTDHEAIEKIWEEKVQVHQGSLDELAESLLNEDDDS